jgi:heptaprenyl diphosphate synthase
MPVIPTTRDDHRIAWLAALAITIHILESALPSPLPGVKPGLANVVTIVVLLRYGWAAAAWVSMLRVLAGSLLLGTFLSPAFVLSFSGALGALAVLCLAHALGRLAPRWALGPIGYSLLAALAHMAGQFWVAWRLFVPHEGLLHLLPILLSVALLFGAVSGVVAGKVIGKLDVRTA